MKLATLTASQLAKKLGISLRTIHRLKSQYPAEAPKTFDDVGEWRVFALLHVNDPAVITRLCR
jgi:hypothetical protein